MEMQWKSHAQYYSNINGQETRKEMKVIGDNTKTKIWKRYNDQETTEMKDESVLDVLRRQEHSRKIQSSQKSDERQSMVPYRRRRIDVPSDLVSSWIPSWSSMVRDVWRSFEDRFRTDPFFSESFFENDS